MGVVRSWNWYLKPCPYCAAPIENDAIQCAYCNRWLDAKLDSTLNADAPLLVLPPRSTSGLAIGSLVCGIFWVGGMGAVAALILGYLALRQIRREPLRVKGKGIAIAGIVLGWVGVAGLAAVITVGVYFWRGHHQEPKEPQAQPVNLITTEVYWPPSTL
jgi:Domain of unknown function (DUF4190)